MERDYSTCTCEAVSLLKQMIATPSTSRQEEEVATLIENYLTGKGHMTERRGNNIICKSHHWQEGRKTLMLNSHMDTVKPCSQWRHNPFEPTLEGSTLFGLGSCDAGGSLVSLLQAFLLLETAPQSYNLLFVATCEEEVSGTGGMKSLACELPQVDLAIVGEPTEMQPAIAEKGLLVLDLKIEGKSGHAARGTGINAITRAMDTITALAHLESSLKVSPLLGKVKITPTVIAAGNQHNVIPDFCTLTMDCRVNELYSNLELLDLVRSAVEGYVTVEPRSTCLNSSSIEASHPIIQRCLENGRRAFGSPTISDQALLRCKSFKMGPGSSERSHTADEFILIPEIEQAIRLYHKILSGAEL